MSQMYGVRSYFARKNYKISKYLKTDENYLNSDWRVGGCLATL